MSAEFWSAAEQFYETKVPMILMVSAFLVQLILFTRMYTYKKRKKWLTLSFSLLIFAFIGYGFWGHQQYQPYIEKSKWVTPLIRDRQWMFFGYKPYTNHQQAIYQDYHMTENLHQLGFYQEERVEEAVSFLGKDGYFYYFEDAKGDLFKQTNGVVFLDEATDDARLTGRVFYLEDKGFKDLGFLNPSQVMYERIEVAQSLKDKKYNAISDASIPQAKDHFIHWIF